MIDTYIYDNQACKTVSLGRNGENLARRLLFDMSALIAEFGAGSFEWIIRRPHEEQGYLAANKAQDGNIAILNITSVDTGISGFGNLELRYYVGEVIFKTIVWRTFVSASLEGGEAPDPIEDYINRMHEIAQEVADDAAVAAESATAAGQSATNAAASEENASASEQAAEGSATAASGYADASARSASAAADSAASASTSAQTATTKAEEASASAQAADASRAAAAISEANATASETAAAQSAATAEEAAQSIIAVRDGKADAIVNSASGAIASFNDGAGDVPARNLVVNIEPVQDLHGYENPWPAGGMGNFADFADITYFDLNGTITATVAADGSITINGTNPSDKASFVRGLFHCPDQTATYTWATFNTVADSNLEFSVRTANFAPAGGWAMLNAINKTNTFTVDSGKTAVYWQIQVRMGATINNVTVKPMIVSGSTAPTTYYPYSNICPITGWDEVKVTRTGKNLLSYSATTQTIGGVTFTATDYEPYTGTEYTTDLPATVYGGTLDVTTGELVVDRAMVDLGTLNWAFAGSKFYAPLDGAKIPATQQTVPDIMCSCYFASSYHSLVNALVDKAIGIDPNGNAYARDTDYSSAPAFKAAMSGIQLVYELATPQTYQLSPQEVVMLAYNNTIWAECGPIVVTYVADTKTYIDNKFAELQALVLENA